MNSPAHDFRGGSYQEIHNAIRGHHELPDGDLLHCHHIIPQQSLKACGLDPSKGPSIQMVRSDHVDTGTYGKDEDAVELRQQITERLSAGDVDGAYTLGVHDVRSAEFGPRYEQALEEAERYYHEEYRLSTMQQLWAREREQTQDQSVSQSRHL